MKHASDFMPKDIQNILIKKIATDHGDMPTIQKNWVIKNILEYNTILTSEQRQAFFENIICKL
jgi:hypothetical protein